MKKKIALLLTLALFTTLLSACSGSSEESTASGSTIISLTGDSARITGGGASVRDNIITISAVGTYTLSGKLDNGQLVIDTGEDAMDVTLVLDGADITNLSDSAIYVKQAASVRIQLAEGSENLLTSGTPSDLESFDENSSGAAIYSEDDVDIEGEGSLSILGYINNGITCKDDLDINGGTISVLAANNGLRGSESVEIKGGDIAITAGNDGVKSSSADKEGKGYVTVSGGNLVISAQGDGVSAETELSIEGGIVYVSATGDPALVSSKAIKANTGLAISGGILTLESVDHGIHSDAGISISGGTISVSSQAGKAIAAHGDILISGGEMQLQAIDDDGIETPGNIVINGGTIELMSGKDGLQAGEANSGLGTIDISGGDISLSAGKRSINARGRFALSGGRVFAVDRELIISLPLDGQSYIYTSVAGAAGETVIISVDGAELMSVEPARAYENVFFSSPQLSPGATCTVSVGLNQVQATAQ